MKRLTQFTLAIVAAAILSLSLGLDAAKEKEKKVPVKIIKASESKFKHAKIIEPKETKTKRFLWFKKREPKVVKPEVVELDDNIALPAESDTIVPEKDVSIPPNLIPENEAKEAKLHESTPSP